MSRSSSPMPPKISDDYELINSEDAYLEPPTPQSPKTTKDAIAGVEELSVNTTPTLTQELQSLQADQKELEKTKGTLAEKEKALEKTRETLAEKEKEIENLTQSLKDLQKSSETQFCQEQGIQLYLVNSNQELRTKILTLEHKNATLEAEKNGAEVENKEWRRSRESFQHDYLSQQQTIDDLTEANKRLHKLVSQASIAAVQLQKNNDFYKGNYEFMGSCLVKTNQKFHAEIDSLESKVSTLEQSLKESQAQCAALQEENELLKKPKTYLQAAKDGISQASTSTTTGTRHRFYSSKAPTPKNLPGNTTEPKSIARKPGG